MTYHPHRSMKSFLWYTAVFCIFISTSGSLVSRHRWSFHYMVQEIEEVEIDSQSWEQQSEEDERDQGTSLIRTPYKNCGSSAIIKNVIVNQCSSETCNIKRGSNVSFNLTFVPKKSATQLKADLHGIFAFIPVPIPCPQPNACRNSGIECPIKPGKVYDYHLSATVTHKYPKLTLWVKGELKDEHGQDVVCVKVHVKLV